MMQIGSFAAKAVGFFAIGFLPQDKPASLKDSPAKPADIKPGTTVIVEGQKLDKPVEAKKVQLIQLEGKKMEIPLVDGKPTGDKKVIGFRLPLPGQGGDSSANGVITIQVVGEPPQGGVKTETRTVTVVETSDAAKPAVKAEARAFVFEGHSTQAPGVSKVIKIVIGDDGKVIRTETQDVKAQQNQTIELQGVLKSLENANPDMEIAIKKALDAMVKGEKLPAMGGNSNVEIRRIQVVGPDMKSTDSKPLIMTPSGHSATATTGTITVTQTPEASKLDAILKRLEKIEKTLEELKAKK